MSDQEISEEQEKEIATRYKKAHYQGWLNQQIVGGGKTVKEAQEAFTVNDERASKYLEKLASIHDTIAAQAKELAAAKQ